MIADTSASTIIPALSKAMCGLPGRVALSVMHSIFYYNKEELIEIHKLIDVGLVLGSLLIAEAGHSPIWQLLDPLGSD
jgi:hypothetical protein